MFSCQENTLALYVKGFETGSGPFMQTQSSQHGRAQEIAGHIAAAIATGNHLAGKFLPTRRQLAEQYKASVKTIQIAIAALVEDGLVDCRHGGKTRVVESPANRHRLAVVFPHCSMAGRHGRISIKLCMKTPPPTGIYKVASPRRLSVPSQGCYQPRLWQPGIVHGLAFRAIAHLGLFLWPTATEPRWLGWRTDDRHRW